MGRAGDVFALAGQAAIQDDGQTFASDVTHHAKARRIYTTRLPLLGVIAAITPFIHRLNMVADKLAPAIGTTNRVVLKPTERSALTALMLADLLCEVGLPPEMLSVVTCGSEAVGETMLTDLDADLVSFTGSVRVGKKIARVAGYRGLVLELGGNAPLIVMEDTDLEPAIELAVSGATKNAGQRCTAVKHILVVESVAGAGAEPVLNKARKLEAGDPALPETDIGTLMSENLARLFERRVQAATARAACVLYGEARQGALFPKTVVDRVPYDCELASEETFEPVIPLIRCPDDISRVIRISDATAFGVASGVCTNRLDYVARFVSELEVGTVNVWEVPGSGSSGLCR